MAYVKIIDILEWINRVVWGLPALALIVGVGIYLSVRTEFAQITLFPKALKCFLKHLKATEQDDGVSSHQALCTALAATVGTGNIAGVAGAISIGGPGAIFWMWVCGILGMITKYAEAVLAVRYRERNAEGEYFGGPMYMIRLGMGKRWSWMAGIYCFFGVVAAFGVGNATQINAVITGINSTVQAFGGSVSVKANLLVAIALAILTGIMLLGGAKGIAATAERLVPAASVLYMLMCFGAVFMRIEAFPTALSAIIKGAFSPQAVTGGAIGSVFTALRVGASRGVFTNEAGMGTAAIAHGSASVRDPVEQGLMGIIEVFLDTIVICTLTALVILCSGVPVAYGLDMGISLTAQAFSSVYGQWICVPLTIALCCFAVATILGWSMYGGRCAQYLFGENAWRVFAILQSALVVIAALLNTGTVWTLSETINGMMIIPNLMSIAWLSPALADITKKYKKGKLLADGGINENFNQRESVRTFSYAEISSLGCESQKRGHENLSSEYWSA